MPAEAGGAREWGVVPALFRRVPRYLSLCTLLVARIGCLEPADDPDVNSDYEDCTPPARMSDYGVYDGLHLDVSLQGALTLTVQGTQRNGHCPPEFSGTARVNGVAMTQSQTGESGCVMPMQLCRPLVYKLDALPTNAGMLDITFDPAGAHDKQEYAPARSWHMRLDWTSESVWIEDDLAARVRADEEFEVHWIPEDAPPPKPQLAVLANGIWQSKGPGADLVSSKPGVARYRFHSFEPEQVWALRAPRKLADSALLCEGFDHCSAEGFHNYELTPGGIAPASPDGVAPPRACLALPSPEGERFYAAPYWQPFPDLSLLKPGSSTACDGGDLYFAVLGNCGACGGGKSTYVIGNRGTQAARFSVRSNAETSDEIALEPQQLSEPIEIGFHGPLSSLEIVSDDDCDAASNKAWVASIACDWPTFPAPSSWKPAGCNNLCGFPDDSAQ